jgi:hypothetical protein
MITVVEFIFVLQKTNVLDAPQTLVSRERECGRPVLARYWSFEPSDGKLIPGSQREAVFRVTSSVLGIN